MLKKYICDFIKKLYLCTLKLRLVISIGILVQPYHIFRNVVRLLFLNNSPKKNTIRAFAHSFLTQPTSTKLTTNIF